MLSFAYDRMVVGCPFFGPVVTASLRSVSLTRSISLRVLLFFLCTMDRISMILPASINLKVLHVSILEIHPDVMVHAVTSHLGIRDMVGTWLAIKRSENI